MRTVTGARDAPPVAGGRALAVGTFDGVHLGHRQVIGAARDWGRANEATVSVVTFDPHPLQLLRPDEAPQLLTPTPVKADLIAELCVDELVVLPFTHELSRVEPADFCTDVLAAALSARHVSVGENFRFGQGARGDAELLRSRPEFETEIVPLVEKDGQAVSSSRVRSLLADGEVSAAADLLGGPFRLEGAVVEGAARGRSLDMPTANIAPGENVLVPGSGIYAGVALDRPAAISIGTRPTFERAGETLVEAHILDFSGDLYGRALRLTFLARLRDELAFESAEDLSEQMQRDVEQVRAIAAQWS